MSLCIETQFKNPIGPCLRAGHGPPQAAVAAIRYPVARLTRAPAGRSRSAMDELLASQMSCCASPRSRLRLSSGFNR
jgi:hypothetical protein